MVGPGAWPEADESVFIDRKETLTKIRSAVTDARLRWAGIQALIFNGLHVWTGISATAAAAKVEKHNKAMAELESRLSEAIQSCQNAADNIGAIKGSINTNVTYALRDIYDLLAEAENENKDASDAVQQRVDKTYSDNKSAIQALADRLKERGFIPEAPELSDDSQAADASPDDYRNHDYANQPGQGDPASFFYQPSQGEPAFAPPPLRPQTEPQPESVSNPSQAEEGSFDPPPPRPELDPAPEFVSNPDQAHEPPIAAPPPPATANPSGRPPNIGGKLPPIPSGSEAASGAPGGAGGIPSFGGGGAPSAPSAPTAPVSPLSGGGGPSSVASSFEPAADASQAASAAQAGAQPPPNPMQQFAQSFANAAGPQMQPASAGMAPPPLEPLDSTAPTNTGPAPAAQSSAQAPVAPPPPATGGGSTGMGMGSGGGGMPPPMPLGPPPTAPPAAPVAPASAPPPPPAAPSAASAAAIGAAPVPVSAARAQRDAAAGLSRRASGSDLVDLARRIGAALNVDVKQPRLFWLTGLTTDGSIVVANNYGIGFIPDGVNLPERVKFVSADESIPPVERGKWATYPIVALHGWAQAHDTSLRAVIATEEQFKGFDSGVAQVVLQPDDLPTNGQMQGRSRLEVIAPDAMAKLAKVSDTALGELLPPAPADPDGPADRRAKLLREVFQPLLSKDPGRVIVHLNAMIAYANHMQELALHRAHTAVGPDAQRAAIADGIYWQHLSVLTTDAISDEQA
ncbi:hypothetical protein AFM11_14260 [Mycolicibacterium wolinskyi]|uniref:Secretion protein EspK n=1 Tax=Mycolicibacterium wolinskyi TaxID=59750 RepID=A0A132PMM2_9MYCO|nr:hypothetical protein AFM11_14260 [Mycolicibacterium wolinskyi]